jgi:subtilisin-like proprotein convertase family protein
VIGGVALLLATGAVGAVLLLPGGSTLLGVSGNRVAIPDGDPTGVTDTVTLDGAGQVQALHLGATITHPSPCDLVVRLISPQGTPVTVADPHDCGRVGPDLMVELDSTAPGSPLAALVGQDASGPWRLQVDDAVGTGEGALTGWGLTVRTG